jgi:HAD superfamily hydrolase (TIGR01549 family)
LQQLLQLTHEETAKHKTAINDAYIKARHQINSELSETASSHNRLLYIQRMLEILNINSMNLALKIYDAYWDTFLNEIKPYDGVIDFLESCVGVPICLVTDLTAHIQHRKIETLGLYKYAAHLVTSEEAGREKPHPYMFMLALKKLNLNSEDVCMIGDNYKKDILGASALGIRSFWLNKDNKKENNESELVEAFKCFNSLKEILNK